MSDRNPGPRRFEDDTRLGLTIAFILMAVLAIWASSQFIQLGERVRILEAGEPE